jgi:hypothetical protein
MPETVAIPNALKLRARAARGSLRLLTSGDLRFLSSRGPWKIEGAGNIEIDGQEPNTVAIALSENNASDDTTFGDFQPSFESGSAHLSLLLSPSQWQVMTDAMHGAREFELSIDAVVSLDVSPTEYAQSFGGTVVIFSLVLSGASMRDA